MTSTTRYYYAVEYAYGRYTLNGWPMADEGDGNRADKIHRFTSDWLRDDWVNADLDNREILSSHSRAVRRVLAVPYNYFTEASTLYGPGG